MDVETGFVIVPDLKWDQKAIEKLYLLVIARNAGIKSLRDLNERHIEFLKNIRVQTYQLLKDQYKLSWKDVRLLVHYQPSYYHFHIHIIHVEISGLSGTIVGQCHLLDDIIDNLETDPAYFQKKTLRYALSVLHPLYDLLSQGS
jgi:m7GpppX diphosphatase